MFNSSEAPTLNDLQKLAAVCQFFLDPKARAKQIEELSAMMIAADARVAAAHEAEAAIALRSAGLDKREDAIREREVELYTKSQLVEGRHRELSDYARHLGEVEDQIKGRLLRHAGLLQHFNPLIQQMPDWAAVDRELGLGSDDPHFAGNEANTKREPVGDNEIPANLVPGSSLTRTGQDRGALRRLEH